MSSTERPRPTSYLIIGWLLALVIAPGVGTLISRSGQTLENRALAPAPEFGWVELMEGDTASGIDHYLEDRLIGKRQAVDTNARAGYEVFGDSTNERVLLGPDGWMFTSRLFESPCLFEWPDTEEVFAALDELRATLESRGAELFFTLVPEKGWVYPDQLPSAVPYRECGRPIVDEFRFAAATEPGYIDLWQAVVDAAAANPEPIYWATDTHWNYSGRLAAVESVVDAVMPGLYDPAVVVDRGPRVIGGGDLAALLGYEPGDSARELVIERPGLTAESEPFFDRLGRRWTLQGDFAPGEAIPGRTFLFTDSHLFHTSSALANWTEDILVVERRDHDLAELGGYLRDADRVVLSFTARDSGRFLLEHAEALNDLLTGTAGG